MPHVPRAIIAETVSNRLKYGERVDNRLLVRRICAPRRERNLDVVAGLLRSFLDGCTAAQNDEVRQRDLLAIGLCSVEVLWIASNVPSIFASSAGWFTSRTSAVRGEYAPPLAPPRLSLHGRLKPMPRRS